MKHFASLLHMLKVLSAKVRVAEDDPDLMGASTFYTVARSMADFLVQMDAMLTKGGYHNDRGIWDIGCDLTLTWETPDQQLTMALRVANAMALCEDDADRMGATFILNACILARCIRELFSHISNGGDLPTRWKARLAMDAMFQEADDIAVNSTDSELTYLKTRL